MQEKYISGSFPKVTRICITGNESSKEELLERLSSVFDYSPHPLCEVRLDYLKLSPKKALSLLQTFPSSWATKMILTQRRKTAFHGVANGHCTWKMKDWVAWWKEAALMQPWFGVDIDYFPEEHKNWIHAKDVDRATKIFYSLHQDINTLKKTLPELKERALSHGTGIKIAAPVQSILQMKELYALQASIPKEIPSITVAMGELGKVWRYSPQSGLLSYFSYTREKSTALGQYTWEKIKPHLNSSKLPDIYILLNQDPNNLFGEKHWNSCLEQQKRKARYISLSLSETKSSSKFKEDVLSWMDMLSIKGASITRPYKESFSNGEKNTSINTIYKNKQEQWAFANTDAIAIQKILESHGSKKQILILGKGGTAKGVGNSLKEKGFSVHYWIRKERHLEESSIELKEVSTIISTWPFFAQSSLVKQLMQNYPIKELRKIPLWIDAQFQYEKNQSPLKVLCDALKTKYIHGSTWWHLQAKEQHSLWFTKESKDNEIVEEILARTVRSKSETIRALFLAATNEKINIIQNPSICEDSLYFLKALKKIGLKVEEEERAWIVQKPKEWNIQSQTISLGESATALRFTAILSSLLPPGTLYLDGIKSLPLRPMGEISTLLKFHWDGKWPIKIPTGQKLPEHISILKSSQYASALIMAWGSLLKTGEKKTLSLAGNKLSFSYIELSLNMLQKIALSHTIEKQNETRTLIHLKKEKESEEEKIFWDINIDFSAIPFLEIALDFYSLPSLYENIATENVYQGDKVFYQLLRTFKEKEKMEVSLSETPDLAPPLWAYAVLTRKVLRIHSTPHLHYKESNRGLQLVNAAKKLGFQSELYEDGLEIIPQDLPSAYTPIELSAKGDHRLAMAYGILQIKYTQIQIDNRSCVKKSFPNFWETLEYIQSCLP